MNLLLGVCASIFVFCTGLCAGVGKEQGWLANAKTLLFVVGTTFAFMGTVAAVLGFGGLFGRNRFRAAAITGLLLGLSKKSTSRKRQRRVPGQGKTVAYASGS